MSTNTAISSKQIILDYIEKFNAHDFEGIQAFLSDDFAFHAGPDPLGAPQFVGILNIVKTAFPDTSMRLEIDAIDGEKFTLLFNNSGTHTGNLDLSVLGAQVVPPTGKTFKLPPGRFDYTVREGAITAIHPHENPGGGFEGILSQLGLK